MRRIKILVSIMLAATLTACQFSISTARITDAQMSKAVNEKKEAVNPTTVFDATDRIHCVVKLANAPNSTKIMAQWIAVNAQGQQPNQKLDETAVNEIGENNIIDFSYMPGADGLPAGEYRVDVYLNPKDAGESKPEKSLNFTVRPSEAMAGLGAQVARAFMSTDQEGEYEVTEYKAGADAFHANVLIRGATPGTKVTGTWVAEQVSEIPPNTPLREMDHTLKGQENIARFGLTYPKGFSSGRYRIEIYINDAARPSAIVPFQVE